MRVLAPCVVAGLCVGAPAVAADDLTVSGSIRLRYEALDGQARAGLNSRDRLTSVRTILSAEYRNRGLRVGGELYDSRAFGGKVGGAIGTGEVNALEPVQLYVGGEVAEPFGKGTKAAWQAGRFTLNLGSRRLIAADDYRNTTNGYTGLRGDVTVGPNVAATVIYVMPQTRLPDDLSSILDNDQALDRESGDSVLWGGLVTKTAVWRGIKARQAISAFANRTRREELPVTAT